MEHPHPDTAASTLAGMPLDQARVRLSEILDFPWRVGDYGPEFASGLQYNALLVTRLRERGVRIWGGD